MPAAILERGKLNALVGIPGSGRTQAALNWAIDRTRSGGTVHWQDFSEGDGVLIRRAHAMGLPNGAAFTVEHLPRLREPQRPLSANTLLVVDYLEATADSSDQGSILERLSQLASDTPATVLVLGLINRGADPASSLLVSRADHAWLVKGPAEEPLSIK